MWMFFGEVDVSGFNRLRTFQSRDPFFAVSMKVRNDLQARLAGLINDNRRDLNV